MIREATTSDFDQIWQIINDGAQAYRGAIPADCVSDPYMSRDELRHELNQGVRFYLFEQDGHGVGVMGIQDVCDVTLFRHAYVRTAYHNRGIGSNLLTRLLHSTVKPVLIGTWRDATWAIRFYQRHGFEALDNAVAQKLLLRYWTVPVRQRELSVVLSQSSARGPSRT